MEDVRLRMERGTADRQVRPTMAAGQAGTAGARWQNLALSVHWFKLFFDSRGNFDTGFENCMLPGNINERIVLFANKHEGFKGHLFSKTGQIGG